MLEAARLSGFIRTIQRSGNTFQPIVAGKRIQLPDSAIAGTLYGDTRRTIAASKPSFRMGEIGSHEDPYRFYFPAGKSCRGSCAIGKPRFRRQDFAFDLIFQPQGHRVTEKLGFLYVKILVSPESFARN